MDIEKVPAIVIGAGVVGCAVAHRLAQDGFEPWVLEVGPRIAEGITSRNSGVIHSGIYYPPSSLKAQSCVRGQKLLYEWCAKAGVAHRKTGKWIVGPSAAEENLRQTMENALASGARGLRWITHSAAIEKELPGVRADYAIYCAESGIIDPYEYARSFQASAESQGALFLMDTRVLHIQVQPSGSYRLDTSRGVIESDIVVNCAGLYSDEIAKMAGITQYRIYPWRGDYFRVQLPRAIPALVYPAKAKGAAGLGVHLTIALDGSFRLGPDVEYTGDKEAFSSPVDTEAKKKLFFEAARIYLKDLALEQLSYDSCGIRPKLRSPDDHDEKDFVLSEDRAGFINLIGIESPGLTAALDLADRVAKLLN